jgi:hypothetical protein
MLGEDARVLQTFAVGFQRMLAVAALALAFAAPASAGADPSLIPVPIGPTAEYRPAARWPLAGAATFGGLRGGVQSPVRAHLELFANRHVVVVPGGIGVSGGRTTRYGFVTNALWHAPAWTLEAGGVLHLERDGMTLGDVFAVWGHPLGRDRMLGFSGRVHAYVNGTERVGDPATIALHDGDQIVLELGGYVPPHASFTFRPVPLSDAYA